MIKNSFKKIMSIALLSMVLFASVHSENISASRVSLENKEVQAVEISGEDANDFISKLIEKEKNELDVPGGESDSYEPSNRRGSGGCSNGIMYGVTRAKCNDNKKCGITRRPATHEQSVKWRQNCVKRSGARYTRTYTTPKKLGCC